MKTYKPNWAKSGEIKKYKDWQEYVNFGANKIINYFEI